MNPEERRLQLLAAGFSPIPCAGKLPVLKAWQTHLETNAGEIALWSRMWPEAGNTGILTRLAPTLDIDISIEPAAVAVEALLRERFEERGHVLVRIGRAPKRAVPFRTLEPFPKILVKLIAPDGKEERLEFLALNQQLVVHGTHPETKKPYAWFGGEPGAVAYDDLPYISLDEARALAEDAAYLLIEEHGYRLIGAKPPDPAAGGRENGAASWSSYLANAMDHDALCAFAMALVGAGMAPGAAVNLLREAVRAVQGEVDEARRGRRLAEIPAMVSSARAKLEAPEPEPKPKRRFALVPFDELKVDLNPAYLVKGLIPKKGLVLIWGPPKCGKSFIAFDLFLHVALGLVYRGRRVEKGPVVYCALEGAAGFGARAEAFRMHRLAENARGVPLYLMGNRLGLPVDVRTFIADIRAQKIRPAAVVIDTLNRSIVGSESEDKDMGAYVKAADLVREAFDCLVAIVHHCGIDGTRPRGHTSLTGAVDAQLAVKREAGLVMLSVEYMKDGPEGETLVSRLEPVEVGRDGDGNAVSSCVVMPVDGAAPPSKRQKLSASQSLALRALGDVIVERGQDCPYAPYGSQAVTEAEWRAELFSRSVVDAAGSNPPARYAEIRNALHERSLIGIRNSFVWLSSPTA